MSEAGQRADDQRWWDISRAAWAEEIASSEAVRLSTIQILGFISICTGVLVSLLGEIDLPPYTTLQQVPGWPGALGILLAVFGLIQLFGVFFSRPWLAIYGSVLGMAWYVWFGGAFIVSWAQWATTDPHTELMPVIYPAAPYFGLAAIHAAQALTTLGKIRSKERRARLLAGGEHG